MFFVKTRLNFYIALSLSLFASLFAYGMEIGSNKNTKKDINNVLISQIKTNDFERVRNILKLGANANSKNESGNSVLIQAVQQKSKYVIEELLNFGAEINARDLHDETPLIIACGLGCKKIAKLLLNKGADVNAQDKFGTTPLILATAFGRSSLVKLLLEKGAKPDILNNRGFDAMHYAQTGEHEEIVDILNFYASQTWSIVKESDQTNGSDIQVTSNPVPSEAHKEVIYISSDSDSEFEGVILLENGSDLDLDTEESEESNLEASDCVCLENPAESEKISNTSVQKMHKCSKCSFQTLWKPDLINHIRFKHMTIYQKRQKSKCRGAYNRK